MTERRLSVQSVIHLQSKTMIRRRLFTRQNSKHDVFYTSKDDIRTFIDNKKASFKQSVLHLNSKNDDNKISFTQQNDKTTRLHI